MRLASRHAQGRDINGSAWLIAFQHRKEWKTSKSKLKNNPSERAWLKARILHLVGVLPWPEDEVLRFMLLGKETGREEAMFRGPYRYVYCTSYIIYHIHMTDIWLLYHIIYDIMYHISSNSSVCVHFRLSQAPRQLAPARRLLFAPSWWVAPGSLLWAAVLCWAVQWHRWCSRCCRCRPQQEFHCGGMRGSFIGWCVFPPVVFSRFPHTSKVFQDCCTGVPRVDFGGLLKNLLCTFKNSANCGSKHDDWYWDWLLGPLSSVYFPHFRRWKASELGSCWDGADCTRRSRAAAIPGHRWFHSGPNAVGMYTLKVKAPVRFHPKKVH